ncbi:conserved oligomeric Golgi complex subunit 4-like isoform X1 [Pomacea canaliculata]|uniref:conserved oligomeric Golgi complex subunit 4-like isoform X1 n=2 Tax=Pomacea canaliculata TaxID=400727 RepID=UPI000D73B840|nr:conserved oligomeric Golgi complex subunit 4-like isoform X1 [Pomacea canaliculata]
MATSIVDATSSASMDSIENLTELDEIKKALEQLGKQEEHVEQELKALLEHQDTLESKMNGLHKMLPNLQILETDSRQLTSMISFTSTLAENVSGKVRKLDLAKSRVVECSQRVEDILDLKFCTDGVQIALQNEDYEKAAGHVHRFRNLDETVIRISAETNEVPGGTLDTSFKQLYESEEKLKNIVHSKFDAAVHCQDVASVERFFKIFPLLAMHNEGITKFGKYLAAQISEKADNNLKLALHTPENDKRAAVLFADTITLLFEGIARVVEIHQPLVETYYGPGRLFGMLQILQKECDRQARKVIEEFKSQRKYDALVRQVQQSMLLQQKQTAGERLDPRELDVILSEIALISARAELYMRFMRRRALGDVELAIQEVENRKSTVAEVEKFWNGCELSRLVQELINVYIMMEEYFMREMILKAVSMDSSEEGQQTSSMVDDTFFIVKKSVRRAISSSNIDGVCAMINHACTVLEQDFREVLYSRLRAGFPSGFDLQHAYNIVQASITQGKLQSSDAEKVKARANFLMSLNNAEVTCDYCKALKDNLEDEVSKLFTQCSEQSKAKLESCLGDLGTVSGRFKDVVDFGFSQLTTSAIKPRIKPVADAFLSTSHNITEEDFSNYEANDPWVQNSIVTLDNMLSTFKNSLTSANYEAFVSLVTTEVTAQLEKAVGKTTFNRLGGLQFDKELRGLVGYLSSVTTWTIRDKFARLTQMATILNLERVSEIMDYWGQNSGPLTWRLTPTEVRQTLTLRIDFRGEDIKRLKL